jgi:hypothetical protein
MDIGEGAVMAQDFTKVSPAVWRSKRFLALDDAGKVLYLYSLTCEHQNSTGCFRLPDAYASADLEWATGKYLEQRDKLVEADLLAIDVEHSMVYVCRWFKHCPPTNASHAIGIMKQIARIDSDSLRERVEAEFVQADQERQQREAAAARKKMMGGHQGGMR